MSAAVKPRNVAFDPMLVAALVALLAIGAIMVGSASISIADRHTGDPLFYLTRHLGAIGIGVLGAVIVSILVASAGSWSDYVNTYQGTR